MAFFPPDESNHFVGGCFLYAYYSIENRKSKTFETISNYAGSFFYWKNGIWLIVENMGNIGYNGIRENNRVAGWLAPILT